MNTKRILLSISVPFCLYCTFSCTKTNNTTTTVRDTTVIRDTTISIIRDTVYLSPKHPITGLWVGPWFTNGDAVDSFMYQISIRADGTLFTIGGGSNGYAGYASGPWKLTGVNFSASLTTMNGVAIENTQTITATYDSAAGRLYNGVWINTRGNTGVSGTFSLMRIQ